MPEATKTKRVRVAVHAYSSSPDPFHQLYGPDIQRALPEPNGRVHSIIVRRDLFEPLAAAGYTGCTYMADIADTFYAPVVFDADD